MLSFTFTTSHWYWFPSSWDLMQLHMGLTQAPEGLVRHSTQAVKGLVETFLHLHDNFRVWDTTTNCLNCGGCPCKGWCTQLTQYSYLTSSNKRFGWIPMLTWRAAFPKFRALAPWQYTLHTLAFTTLNISYSFHHKVTPERTLYWSHWSTLKHYYFHYTNYVSQH